MDLDQTSIFVQWDRDLMSHEQSDQRILAAINDGSRELLTAGLGIVRFNKMNTDIGDII